MALGVLNNLAATYAENNLNNTTNSLNTVLQQLSSGSRINSGADDAAGLSLVNGLEANSTALTQSRTNAQEGVGLLQVADGALSQVTSLLNRAVTLATEAANGTLNPTQDSAANQEYQSILSEISNIGTTTTFNQEQVFGSGSNVNIYTGDSSTKGSSVDSLNLATLSDTSVGDTAGVINYSTGNNVFLDLTGTSNAQSTDTINAGTLTINYKDASGNAGAVTVTPASTSIGSLITAIDGSGRGLTATFTTAAAAGDAGAAASTDTGIEISGAIGVAVPTATTQQLAEGATGIWDTSAGQTAATAPAADATGGVATLSYTDASGANLASFDLLSQNSAQSALTTLNTAISDVAAQDGYIGAQINTLNAVSQVLSTQSENVTSAQNAVQATDYASATSNLSKYEILSQTGISALAQANSLQQEVTKLLQ